MTSLKKTILLLLLTLPLMTNLQAQCRLFDLDVNVTDCNEENEFSVLINFEYTGVSENGFSIKGNGKEHGVYDYEDLPIDLGPFEGDCETNWEFIIRDLVFEDCKIVDEIGTVCCINECNINKLTVETSKCEEERYDILLDFEHKNTSPNGFNVFLNGNKIRSEVDYKFPIVIEDIEDNGDTIQHLLICDELVEECCEDVNFISPCVCRIADLVVETHECDENKFLVDFDFKHNRSDTSQFVIRGNGVVYDTFNYGEDFYTIGPLAADCETFYEFVLVDLEFEACRTFLEFDEPVCCGEMQDCRIGEIEVEPIECTGEGVYSLWLNFFYEGNTNDYFDVLVNGEIVGFYKYEDLPIIIKEFPERDVEFDIITICDNDNRECCKTLEFRGLNCDEENDDCKIFDAFAERHECNEDKLFFVNIAFEHNDKVGDKFIIRGNGVVYDTFEYGESYYTFGPLEGDCETLYEFVIIDLENPDCKAETFWDEPVCCGEMQDCRIGEIEVEPIECTGDGVYSLWLNFFYEGNTNDYFDVLVNGEVIGFYKYEDLPIIIKEFPERDVEFDIITICDNDNRECCKTLEFRGLNCDEENDDCKIFDAFAERHECNEDKLFFVDIAFEHNNNVGDKFIIRGNGVVYDTFEYGKPYYTFGPLEGDCETLYEFIIIDLENPDCKAETFWEEPVCCGEMQDCRIGEIEVEPIECTGEGVYSLWLNFFYEGNTNDYFDVLVNGEIIGFYKYEDLPIIIKEFPERDVEFDIITICDNDNRECCKTLEFRGLNCDEENDDCKIFDAFAERHECNEDGYFKVNVGFKHNDNIGDRFIIRGNGVVYDTFEYGESVYTFGPLEGDCETLYEFIIIDLENPDCKAETFWDEPVCCGEMQDCRIGEIEVEPIECTGDGVYSLWLNFFYEGNTNDYFDVLVNGEIVGFYKYEDLPIIIKEFPERDVEFDIITICDNDNRECCKTLEFRGLNCDEENDDCKIFDAFAERHECNEDKLFFVDIAFEHNNNVGDKFIIRGNGVVYDTFEYGESYYTFGPLEGDCETLYEFIIIDLENPDCKAETFWDEPVCCGDEPEDCSIIIDFTGNYEIIGDIAHIEIDLITNGTGDLGFDAFLNNEFIGFYRYENLPLFLEIPLGNISEEVSLLICDNDSDCCAEFSIDVSDTNICEIFNFQYEIIECEGGEFYIEVDLNHISTNSDSFYLLGNGIQHGTYAYDDLPVTIGPFTADLNIEYELVAIDLENDDCSEAVEIGKVDCESLSVEDEIKDQIKIMSLPGFTKLIINDYSVLEYAVYDFSGRLIKSDDHLNDNEILINTSQLSSGVYIVNVNIGNHNVSLLVPILNTP